MSTQSVYHTKSGPAIGLGDPANERDKLIAANYAFAVALRQPLNLSDDSSVYRRLLGVAMPEVGS